ncbi:MAG: hypothetical protein ND807_07245 [Vicinamibacterales bacterium]|nr:hypothetical protein [Vicinamibacterales bacterium]
MSATNLKDRFEVWFFEGYHETIGPHAKPVHTAAWWKVMCLTGVDYFSTLAYQPSIAFLAAGYLSPVATLVLILLTLFGALPMYSRIAHMSPRGQGSILILEKLFPRWKGKAVVLCLLGFAATDFVITITLSAADATAHMIENPLVPRALDHPVGVTIVLLIVLGLIFLKGFSEALGIATLLVLTYIGLNLVVLTTSIGHVIANPDVVRQWRAALFAQHGGNPLMVVAFALLLFPKLALGLSGFETGVAVMPLVKGDPDDTEENPKGRIANTIKLLRTAALIMSVLLLSSSFVTTLLIPSEAFAHGGPADGRALAYLAHAYLGTGFGTLYDISTVAILWFAGASAMAGLLNLIPRYLPRYGMAPEWARAQRPLVTMITGITIFVTIIFNANVDAQGGAYATGVLVLMSSGAIAVATMAWRDGRHKAAFTVIAIVFLYTTVTNMFERPEGLKIASVFILTIVGTSLISRVLRSTELRVRGVEADRDAMQFIQAAGRAGPIRIIANRPDRGDREEYENKLRDSRETHHLPNDDADLFLEVRPGDVSEFSEILQVRGVAVNGFRILRCQSPAIPNTIAALLLYIRDTTGQIPHAYFGWTEGNPITYLLKFLAFGEGDTAPVTREVLRQAEKDPLRRPRIHVG